MGDRKLASKTMYRVEKFLPPECPKCRHKFDKIGTDWAEFLGDIVDGKNVIRETEGYTIIVCSRCENFTASIPLESYTLSDSKAAKKLLKEGFVNFQKVRAYGNMTRDCHIVHAKLPDVCVRVKTRGGLNA